MTYPNKEQILKIMTEIEKKKGKIDVLKPLTKNSSPVEKWKFKISQKISEFRVVRGLTLEEMSSILGTDKANISRIMNGHIEKVTLDKLLQYLEITLIASKNKKAIDKFHMSADKFFDLDDIKFA